MVKANERRVGDATPYYPKPNFDFSEFSDSSQDSDSDSDISVSSRASGNAVDLAYDDDGLTPEEWRMKKYREYRKAMSEVSAASDGNTSFTAASGGDASEATTTRFAASSDGGASEATTEFTAASDGDTSVTTTQPAASSDGDISVAATSESDHSASVDSEPELDDDSDS